MQREMDMIQFESRQELQDLMEVVAKYIKMYPGEKDNETLKTFYGFLDVMEMEW